MLDFWRGEHFVTFAGLVCLFDFFCKRSHCPFGVRFDRSPSEGSLLDHYVKQRDCGIGCREDSGKDEWIMCMTSVYPWRHMFVFDMHWHWYHTMRLYIDAEYTIISISIYIYSNYIYIIHIFVLFKERRGKGRLSIPSIGYRDLFDWLSAYLSGRGINVWCAIACLVKERKTEFSVSSDCPSWPNVNSEWQSNEGSNEQTDQSRLWQVEKPPSPAILSPCVPLRAHVVAMFDGLHIWVYLRVLLVQIWMDTHRQNMISTLFRAALESSNQFWPYLFGLSEKAHTWSLNSWITRTTSLNQNVKGFWKVGLVVLNLQETSGDSIHELFCLSCIIYTCLNQCAVR